MSRYDYDIGVIGGGAAGLTVTSGAAQLGAKTLLVEKGPALGGDCLHYGCVPSKTLIRTARLYHQMRHSTQYGLPVIDAPPADFRDVAARIRSVIDTIQVHDSPERFRGLGADVRFGSPRFGNEHAVELDGRILSARKWVLATGSGAAIPPIPGLDGVSYLTNRHLFSLDRLPRSLIVLGGGAVAVEMAQAFCRLGTKVTVIQRSAHILSREDSDMADLVMDRLAAEGVEFYLEATVERVWEESGASGEKVARVFQKSNAPGGGMTELRAEALLVAMGRRANTDGLGLEEIGVQIARRGVVVDAHLRTTRKHIFAAGDVTGQYQFTHAAGYEGGVVISNAVIHFPSKADYAWMPRCTYTDPELACIGRNERALRADGMTPGEDYTVWTEPFASNDRALAEGAPEGMIKLLLDRKERPLGVQICGLHGGDLLGEWVGVLAGGVSLRTLGSAVHPYPTLAEINKRVVGQLLGRKLFSDKVRKILSLVFRYRGGEGGGEG